ncbi:MAG: homoserine kinase [Gammaproteobacteria bacterium]|nr:homoserine kinase [Gammaproteobacteria bacterium]MBQ0840939.1 homoserine kinase [Gammaproteobacteria bacterium]
MAVFTRVDPAELQALLTALGLGHLLSTTEVADGVENSTYFIEVAPDPGSAPESGGSMPSRLVLTLLEAGNRQQGEFSTALAQQLHRAGLAVPKLFADASGCALHRLADKPALLSERIDGAHPEQVTLGHCRAIGEFLGTMHGAGVNLPLSHNNLQGLPWAQATLDTLIDSLPAAEQLSVGDQALLQAQIARYRSLCEGGVDLPCGAIHADLFRDNTLFVGEELKAVIDFNSACSDYLLLDVAIAVNDWACKKHGELDPTLVKALLDGYQQQRPFTLAERQNWQDMLCFAATLFWLSRLLTWHLESADLTNREAKDPGEYRQKLQHRLLGVVAITPCE